MGVRVTAGHSWDQARHGRHHRVVDAAVGDAFWERFMTGARSIEACRTVGVGCSTGYRWPRARSWQLREQGISACGQCAAGPLWTPT